ncbi:hypothetical protein DFH08DRAFT_436982 [Mycena albidolilacea]|uniref:DUF2235 domain-containing protein n=1 Tax=Mycena albidolilacea TaxID=1033008 RepID=A0AAD7AFY8_9AGAR|nr:hypothetical protein DFH08DRAFT_436982 [Mycena albidolilacea]
MSDDIEADTRGAGTTDDNPETGTGLGTTDTTDTVVTLPHSDAPTGSGTTPKDSVTITNDPGIGAEQGAASSKDTIAQPNDSGANSDDTGTTANGSGPGANDTESGAKETINIQTTPQEATFNERKLGADKTKRQGDQPKRRPTKCGCVCDANCNCKCTCAHEGHCVCISPCDGQCGTRVSRNLVVSIDGTSNQFGQKNTNVVALHNRVLRDAKQNKYYNCGIGTYVPDQNKMSWKYWQQKFDNALDLAFAFKFKEIILKAYRWLSETYQPGDKIFLFGFSRGAYQVRTLAGMIETIGLIDAGNDELIPFGYEIYSERHKGALTEHAKDIATTFKETCSREIRIHFVGVWDTVSSIGVFRGKPLPLTSTAEHICIVRHALALDERRVKFLPEYINHGDITSTSPPIDIKEVWFAGSHSDIGGGLQENTALNLSSVPLLWMENEAEANGLRLKPRASGGVWDLEDLQKHDGHESLRGGWKPMEYLPLTRLSFQTAGETTRVPHRGAGRIIAAGQRIHISVAFKNPNNYHPRADFLESDGIKWESFVGGMIDESKGFEWALDLGGQVELDLFDASFTTEAITKLQDIWKKGSTSGADDNNESYWMNRLAFMAPSGRLAEQYVLKLESRSLEHRLEQIHSGVALFQKLEYHHSGTFDKDVATLLEQEGQLLFGLKQADKALHIYREAEILWRNRTTKAKARLKDHEKVAGCLKNIARCCDTLERQQDKLETELAIVDLYRNLPDNDPIIAKHLAQSLITLGIDLNYLGHHEDALKTDEEAVELCQKLVEIDPTVTGDLAWSLNNLGVYLSNLGQREKALHAVEEAVEIHRKLVQNDPTVTQDLAVSLDNLGLYFSNLGQHEKALHAAEEVVEIHRKLETGTTHLAWAIFSLGFQLRLLGRHTEALAADAEATEIHRRIAETDLTGRKSLAISLENLGLNLNAVGRCQDAVQASEEAVKIYQELPDQPVDVKLYLANSQKLLAVHLRAVDRHEDALHNDKQGDKIFRELGETDPGPAADSVHTFAVDLRSIGLHQDALQAEESAVALYRKLPQMAPGLFRDFIDALESLARNLRAIGREEDATQTEIEVANLKSSSAQGPNPSTDAAQSSSPPPVPEGQGRS